MPVLGDLDQVDAVLRLDLGFEGVAAETARPGDVADRAALRVFAQGGLHRGGALVERDFLVDDDEDFFHERAVFGNDELVRLAFVLDEPSRRSSLRI